MKVQSRLPAYLPGVFVTAAVVVAGALLMAVLNLVPPASPLHVPDFAVSLTAKYLSYALLRLPSIWSGGLPAS